MTQLSTEQIWDDFSDGLRSFIGRRVDSESVADDLLQEVFVRIHRSLETVADSERVAGWVYRIARNAITDYRRRGVPCGKDLSLSGVVDTPVEPPDDEDNINPQVANWLRGFVDRLPEGYREVTQRFEFEGTSQAAIADELNLSVPAVKSRVRRGRLLLKEMLKECCRFELDRAGNILDFEPRQQCDDC